MSDNALKTPLAVSLDALARGRSSDIDQLFGKELPCSITEIISSNLVKVKFEIEGPFTLPEVTIPVSSPHYDRIPYQVGDKGVARKIDYYQGGITKDGGGVADYAQRANLTNLQFTGVGQKEIPGGNGDLNARQMYGKNGVVLADQDADGNRHVTVTVTPEKIIIDLTNAVGAGKTVEIKGTNSITFDGDLRVKGNVIAGFGSTNKTLLNHTHAQGNDSHGDTEVETNSPTAGT